MANYVLTCCSTADLPYEYFQERDIPYICFHYILDGKDYSDDLGKTIPFAEFYQQIADGALPTTSQVTVGEYLEFFEAFFKQGKDILHIAFSSGLSGSYNSARVAREQLQEKYPERTLEIVDSLGASSGYGLLVDMAADLRDSGQSLADVQAWAETNKLNVHHWFFSTDLSHYKRGGRISTTSALVGSLLNICPLMNMDAEGKLIPRVKIRGKKRVMTEIVKRMEEHSKGGLDYTGKCFISNSACYEDARKVADMIEEKFPNLQEPVRISSVGTLIGSHTGIGTVALFFEGDLRE